MTLNSLSSGSILLTGASGYIGGRLLGRLEGTGHPVRCLARRPATVRARARAGTEVVAGDLLDRASLDQAMQGVGTAYYLAHAMAGPGDYVDLDRRAALNFGDAARLAGVRRIIYLGGLGDQYALSPHLKSRQEVGRLLRGSGVPTIELRASIVIGSGSASYETVRALVEQLPAIVVPRWAETLAQPIAIEDVLDYLMAMLGHESASSLIYDIGGADQVTYVELLREYARARGLRRRVLRTRLLSPTASRLLLGLLTPVYGRVAATMVDSLRYETTVRSDAALRDFALRPRGVSAAIGRALENEDAEFAETRWSDALSARSPRRWGGMAVGRRLINSRVGVVSADAERTFTAIQRLGGATGWYGLDGFWKLRGQLDTLTGGMGLRRGRRDPHDLRVGDPVDFWRVERFEAGRLVRLVAEMNLPGRLWLQFEVCAGPRTEVRQTTVFDPAGYAGLAYWYALYPVHERVFQALLEHVCLAAEPGR